MTGHEDGSVRLWNFENSQMTPIAKINTMKYFNTG